MRALWPGIDEERAIALADRAADWRKDELISRDQEKAVEAALGTQWHSFGLIVSALLFIMTSNAVAFGFFMIQIFEMPAIVVAILALIAAEALILGVRLYGTGIESALWIGGLLGFIFSLPSSGKPEAILVIAAAILIAGLRMLNPFFITAAVGGLFVYFAAKPWPLAAILGGIAGAAIAMASVEHEWRRPSMNILAALLMIIVPVAGVIAGEIALEGNLSSFWAAAFFVLGAAAFALGIRSREHSFFVAGFVEVCLAYGILVVAKVVTWKPEIQAIVGGIVMLGVAAIVSRMLRGRTSGITTVPIRMGALEEVGQIAGAIHVQHQPEPASTPAPVSGGGQFGGAGASGEY